MGIQIQDLSVRPTRHGLLFLGILAAMLLGSVNYNNNAGFLLVFLLGGMAGISLVHSFKNLLGLVLIPHPVPPVFKGESMIFPVGVNGRDGQAQALYLSIGGGAPFLLPLSAGERPAAGPALPAQKRGRLAPGEILLTSVYPFGLFRLKAVLPLRAGGIVYPAPEPGMVPAGHTGSTDQGLENSQNTTPGDFQGLKPYVPGNPVTHISWKALSRGQGLFVKDFAARAGSNIWMDLDMIRQGGLEQKLSVLCHGILRAEQAGLTYGLCLGPAVSILPARGSSHLRRCLKALALYGSPGTLKETVTGAGQ